MSAYGDDNSPGGRRPYATGRPSTGGHHQLVPMAMAIPGSQRRQEVPPPLPPPRYADVERDNRPADSQSPRWRWDSDGSFGKSRPSASSAQESFPKSWTRSRDDDSASYLSDNRRRQSDNDAMRFRKDPRYDASSRFDEGYHSMSLGLPSMSSQSVFLLFNRCSLTEDGEDCQPDRPVPPVNACLVHLFPSARFL